jgi:hypothetical protein
MGEGLNQQWKDAIETKQMDKMMELCRIETMSKTARGWTELLILEEETPLSMCIKLFVPAYRIKYLVEKCGQTPNSSTLELAVSEWHWTAVNYLHEELGIRHSQEYFLHRHLDHIHIQQCEEKTIEFALLYIPLLSKSKDSITVWLHDVARFRKKQAYNASVALLGLKRRKNPFVYNQDVLSLISKIVMKKENVARKEWGYPKFFQRKNFGIPISKNSKDVFKVWVKLGVVYLVWVFFYFTSFL